MLRIFGEKWGTHISDFFLPLVWRRKMKDGSSLINLISSLAILIIAAWLNRLLDSLREYTGATFDFRSGVLGQLGLALLFGLLLVAFVQIAFVLRRPAVWVFGVYIALALLTFLPLILTFIIPIEIAFLIPQWARGLFISPPVLI